MAELEKLDPPSDTPPLGETGFCHALWKYAWALTGNTDTLNYKKNLVELFFIPFRTILSSALVQLSTSHKLPALQCQGLYLGGSAANGVHMDESDLDIVVRLNDQPVICTNEGQWFWDDKHAIKDSHRLAIYSTICECVKSFLNQNKHLGFELVSQNTKDKCRFTFVNGILEFDLLFSLHGAGFWGLIGSSSFIRSHSEIGTARIYRAACQYPGLRQMIRVLKFAGYRYRDTTPEFKLPSCTFEAAMLAYVNGVATHTWNNSSFHVIFLGCLLNIQMAVDGISTLSPPNDSSANLIPDDPHARSVIKTFLKQWSSIPQDKLLHALTTRVTESPTIRTGLSSPNPQAPTPSSSAKVSIESQPQHGATGKVHKLFDRAQETPLQNSALSDLSDSGPVNCVAVIGHKGQGKSFLLSSIVALTIKGDPAFPSLHQPTKNTTSGVDALVLNPAGLFNDSIDGKLLLLDVEGTGMNGDIEKVMIPAMMASQVIIYNCLGSFPVDNIINDLSVYTTKAQKLQPRDESAPVGHLFGRLVFVIRDADELIAEDARKRFYRDIGEVGVAESSLQAQAAARAMITKYFAGIDFAWLPSPNDDMNANKFQVSLVTDEFRISLQRLLDQHVRPYLSSSLPSMPNTVLTGELLRIMLDRFAAGADNMTITSLFMMVHELNVQKFMESFQLQLNRLTESFELPVLLALIHAAITDLLDNSSNNLLHELSDLPAKLREEALERMKQDSQKCIERLEAQNQKVLTEKCMRIVNDVVTDALKMQFESSEPILPGDLESMVISELDDTLPSIATGSLRASCFEEARKTLAKHYNRPSQSDIVSAILQAASLTVNGQRHRGHELLTKWHKWMLRAPSAEELVALAGRLLIVPLAYAKNLAGELLSLAWIKEGMSLENCSFRNHFGLLILLAQYYGEQAPPHQDTEKIFLAGIELVKVQAPKQISDARCALAQFHKSQGRIDQALELYIEALQGDGTVGSVTLLGYLRCLAQAEGVKAAHDVALELLPSNKSTDDFGYVVYTTYLQRIISADEASAILLPAMENVFKLQDLPIHYWLIWWMELTKSFKPGKEMENPKAQSLSDILELWIGRAQNSFASMLIDGGSSHVAESLGLYWWKFSRESNPDLAHKYLLMALETSEGISSTYLLYRSFLLEYPDFLHAAGAAADPSMGSFLSLLGSSSREATATRFGDTNLRSLEASHEDDDSFRHHHLSSSSSSLSDSSSGEEYEKKFLGSALLLDLLSRALSSARSPKANSADPSKDFVDLDEMPEPGPSS